MWNKEKIHRIKIALLIMTVAIMGVYLINKLVLLNRFDSSYPEISFDKELIEVSVKVTEEELLNGVSAFDKKDGDVTDSIIIEKMSDLLEGNQRIVTYVAFDGDNHVGKAERKIQYTDYTPIRFSLKEPMKMLTFNETTEEVLSILQATDCIDGDISSSILLDGEEIVETADGNAMTIYNWQVTNSCGDLATLKLPVKVNLDGIIEMNHNAEITLKHNLVYSKIGKQIDLKSMIEKVMVRNEAVSTDKVEIYSEVDVFTPGAYTVTYSVLDNQAKARSYLIVIVEE